MGDPISPRDIGGNPDDLKDLKEANIGSSGEDGVGKVVRKKPGRTGRNPKTASGKPIWRDRPDGDARGKNYNSSISNSKVLPYAGAIATIGIVLLVAHFVGFADLIIFGIVAAGAIVVGGLISGSKRAGAKIGILIVAISLAIVVVAPFFSVDNPGTTLGAAREPIPVEEPPSWLLMLAEMDNAIAVTSTLAEQALPLVENVGQQLSVSPLIAAFLLMGMAGLIGGVSGYGSERLRARIPSKVVTISRRAFEECQRLRTREAMLDSPGQPKTSAGTAGSHDFSENE